MKIYFKKDKIKSSIPRKFYSDWIKPVFPHLRHSIYGIKQQDLKLSENPENAHLLILPLTWNYYFEYGKIDEAIDILQQYYMLNKPIITWVSGDYKYVVPDGDFILLQHNLFRSKQKSNEHAYPAIIRDPFDYLKFHGISIASKPHKPTISFCGLANRNFLDKYENLLKELFFKMKNKIFKPYLDLNSHISGMELRGELLKSIAQNTNLDTNLIIRKRKDRTYIENEKYKFEYWNNMLSTPFTLCVRGNGNFSVRFYETLALGRIPILFDTDCVLPLSNEIDWKKHCLIIKKTAPSKAVNVIAQMIKSISEDHTISLQISNRKLWLDNLSFSGFYYSFRKQILKNFN